MPNQLVALGDILGFKNTILHTPLQTVVQNYLGFFRRALQHAMEAKGWPEAPTDFAALRRQSSLGIEWFSDTIIIYTKEDTDIAATNLMQVVNWLLFETLYHHATRLRFGVDYGELHVDTNAGQLVGRALVGAHQLEANQRWAGGALTLAATQRLPQDAQHYVVNYPVPLKNDEYPSTHAINWTQGVHLGLSIPFAPDRASPDEHDPADIVEKWRNTLAFHAAVCGTCRRHHS